MRYLVLIALALTSACSRRGPTERVPESGPAKVAASGSAKVAQPASPARPASPSAKPSHGARDSLPETPFSETSAQGAANVVQTYAALVEARKYQDAASLWEQGGSGEDYGRFREWHAEVGGPGRIEGAAGSLYVQVPMRIYGRQKDGASFSRCAVATLRRVNGVPGSTAEQNRWHIIRIADLDTTGPCLEARLPG